MFQWITLSRLLVLTHSKCDHSPIKNSPITIYVWTSEKFMAHSVKLGEAFQSVDNGKTKSDYNCSNRKRKFNLGGNKFTSATNESSNTSKTPEIETPV